MARGRRDAEAVLVGARGVRPDVLAMPSAERLAARIPACPLDETLVREALIAGAQEITALMQEMSFNMVSLADAIVMNHFYEAAAADDPRIVGLGPELRLDAIPDRDSYTSRYNAAVDRYNAALLSQPDTLCAFAGLRDSLLARPAVLEAVGVQPDALRAAIGHSSVGFEPERTRPPLVDWHAGLLAGTTEQIVPSAMRPALMALGRLLGRCDPRAPVLRRAGQMHSALVRRQLGAGATLASLIAADPATWLPRLGAPELDRACGLGEWSEE